MDGGVIKITVPTSWSSPGGDHETEVKDDGITTTGNIVLQDGIGTSEYNMSNSDGVIKITYGSGGPTTEGKIEIAVPTSWSSPGGDDETEVREDGITTTGNIVLQDGNDTSEYNMSNSGRAGSLSLHTHLVHPHTEATEGTIEFAYAANFQAPITAEGGIKISNKGDENAPAGTVSGDIEVVGEVFAKSFHVVDFVGNQLSNFFSDGSSSQEGKATFKSGIKMTRGSLEFPDGTKQTTAGGGDNKGDMTVKGEILAKSFHVVSFDSSGNVTDTLTSFNSDGTSLHKGKETFKEDVVIFGSLSVQGFIEKTGGGFKIDHPIDPANKYLNHAYVESPDMMNVYNGNVILNPDGEAIVELPEWFEALNKDFRYQLTCIGGFAPVFFAEEISNNRFKIAGGKSGMKVSWQVTGIRKDA